MITPESIIHWSWAILWVAITFFAVALIVIVLIERIADIDI